MTPHAKFCVNLTKGASPQIDEIYAKFLFMYTFLRAKAATAFSAS